MFCKNCGTQLDDGLKFCTKCGAKLEREMTSVMADDHIGNHETQDNGSRSMGEIAADALAGSNQQTGHEMPLVEQPAAKNHTRRNTLIAVAAAVLVVVGIVVYNAVIKPRQVQAHIEKGNAYYEQDDYDRAIADYNQAIRLDPNYVNAYINRGNAYQDKGDYERAIADFTQAIRLNPYHAVAYYNRGNAYYHKGDY